MLIGPRPETPPLDLPRLLMRRAGAVAAAVLALALGLGLLRMAEDIDSEVDAALTLAGLMAGLGGLERAGADGADGIDDSEALAALRRLAAAHPPRHLLLRVEDESGRLLLAPPPLPPAGALLDALLALHRRLLSAPDLRQAGWTLLRPGGARWTVTLTASHESERRESLLNLLATLGLLLACIAGLLLAMRWNLRRALAPLGRLLEAIAGIEQQDGRAVQALATMPIRELEAVAAALRHLGAALSAADAQRRLLGQQVLTLQEDERARLARELHDEFGQRLTALRVDAAWLARRLAAQPGTAGTAGTAEAAEAGAVVAGMADQCQQIQHDIRSLLARLQPFGPGDGAAADGVQSLGRLTALLRALVAGWSGPAGDRGTRYRLDLLAEDPQGRPQPWPEAAAAEALLLPQALALALYRISQEALTNVARHAGAGQATLQLVCRGRLQPGAPVCIAWSVVDDGVGLPAGEGGALTPATAAAPVPPAAVAPVQTFDAAQARGNGLSGLRERVWAQGGALQLSGAAGGRGLALAARFASVWQGAPPLSEAVAR